MIIVKIDNKTPLEKALKTLKSKVIKTKQNEILRDRKEFVKKSVALRLQKKKAIFRQQLINSHLNS
jgi:ribosomal protein S21